jgi:hypothetical protein
MTIESKQAERIQCRSQAGGGSRPAACMGVALLRLRVTEVQQSFELIAAFKMLYIQCCVHCTI